MPTNVCFKIPSGLVLNKRAMFWDCVFFHSCLCIWLMHTTTLQDRMKVALMHAPNSFGRNSLYCCSFTRPFLCTLHTHKLSCVCSWICCKLTFSFRHFMDFTPLALDFWWLSDSCHGIHYYPAFTHLPCTFHFSVEACQSKLGSSAGLSSAILP